MTVTTAPTLRSSPPRTGRGSALRTVRVGAVSFTNTIPLIYKLAESSTANDTLQVQLRLSPPAELADSLHAGQVTVGLIPIVEHYRARGRYRFLTDVGICSRGAVDSVLLFCRKPTRRVRTVLADRRSRTSVALAQVWFAQAHGTRLEVLDRFDPVDKTVPTAGTGSADAVLVIGDAAWFVPREGWEEIIDLGEAWYRLTGLGFVYAGWSARPELSNSDAAELSDRLIRAKTAGVAALDPLSVHAAARAGVPTEKVRRYWTENIRFDIREPERRGRDLFARWCGQLGLL